MTDPAAIDLESIKKRHNSPFGMSATCVADLIAAVEALRERYESLAESNDEHCDRANAAEARVAELARELKSVTGTLEYVHGPDWETVKQARTVLASTPAEALERARAKDEVIRWATEIWHGTDFHEEMGQALAKLDALQPTEGDGT